jgi:hypothetical protein
MTMMIIKIIFPRTHALPPCVINCDITIHKYATINEGRSATDSCSQMFTLFGFNPEQVFLNSSKQIYMTAILI